MFKTIKDQKVNFNDKIKKIIEEKKEAVDHSDSDSDDELPLSAPKLVKSKASATKMPIARESKTKLSELSEAEKKERHKEQMKKWREEHPDYNKTYRQKYYQEHREEILEKRRQKRLEDKKLLEEFKVYKSKSLLEKGSQKGVKGGFPLTPPNSPKSS